jgi:hypothetical protein
MSAFQNINITLHKHHMEQKNTHFSTGNFDSRMHSSYPPDSLGTGSRIHGTYPLAHWVGIHSALVTLVALGAYRVTQACSTFEPTP